ncbi:MAG: tRNA (cytidine(34)-2'-O)-methyltransferase [Planctomycetota bacterium]
MSTVPLSLPPTNAEDPLAHVVLFQPEIPQNTGNIARTCVAVGAKLWIVKPMSFSLDERRVRRAGLDYWPHLSLQLVENWDELLSELSGQRFFFFTKFAKRGIHDTAFKRGDVLVFGRETSGLPKLVVHSDDPRCLRLPMTDEVRSLNLSNTVAIALYEHLRQVGGER